MTTPAIEEVRSLLEKYEAGLPVDDAAEAEAALIAAAPDLARAYIRLAEAAEDALENWPPQFHEPTNLRATLSLPLRSEEEGT